MNPIFSLRNKRVWVAGHNGMVGAATVRRLQSEECEILTVPRRDLDLRRQSDVECWMETYRPEVIILAAARVGGIKANRDEPADFLYDNLMIETNVIYSAHKTGVQKLLFLGSSCIYPKHAPQPIEESALLSGPLEPTNAAYAVAKIAGIKLCESYRKQFGADFISAMPCNLYGPSDTYDTLRSHVIPALVMKFHQAKEQHAPSVTLWGTGTPLREFLHVDDLADALIFLLKNYSTDSHINVGSGAEISIAALAGEVAAVTGYKGEINFDPAMPDGTPRKLMDNSRLSALGWQPRIALRDGLQTAYADYLKRVGQRDAA
jgi:GDP-L-fucose synthase